MNTTTDTTARCKRCHRVLTSADSIKRGYGPTCATKAAKAATVTNLAAYRGHQIDSAREAIADGAVLHLRGRVYLVVSTDGTEVHRAAVTGQCNCAAGLRGATCYHTAAARILAAA